MGQLEGKWIAGATIPGLIIAILFYFDHSVSAQLAQMPEYNIKRPTAYHYDLALLGVTTIVCGVLGVPPPQGSLPQAPLHSKSLATMRTTQIEARLTVSTWPLRRWAQWPAGGGRCHSGCLGAKADHPGRGSLMVWWS